MIDALMQRIEAKRDDLIALTRDLVSFPTVNPPGEAYAPCAHFIGDRLREHGFEISYMRAHGTPGDSERYPRTNVIARREAERVGPCIHFNGHIDVVAAGQGWTRDPWRGEVAEGRIYGRGTCDMKGGLAAAIVAVECLVESGLPLRGALEVSGTVDEESGGYGGVAWLARQGLFSPPRVDHVIIPEPLGVDRVCIGHRGVWWAEIETLGRTAHGSMPFLGECAVRHMGAVLDAFESDLIPALGRRHTSMPVVPDAARASTLNFNGIHGGQEETHGGLPSPCVPDSCRLVLDRRFLVEEDLEGVKAEVTALLEKVAARRPGLRWNIRDIMEVHPVLTEPDRPVPRAVAQAVAEVLGRDATFICSPGTYDQKHIARTGHLHDCVAYGPGRLELAHQPDEFVAIDDLVAAARVMALAALDLMNNTDIGSGRHG